MKNKVVWTSKQKARFALEYEHRMVEVAETRIVWWHLWRLHGYEWAEICEFLQKRCQALMNFYGPNIYFTVRVKHEQFNKFIVEYQPLAAATEFKINADWIKMMRGLIEQIAYQKFQKQFRFFFKAVIKKAPVTNKKNHPANSRQPAPATTQLVTINYQAKHWGDKLHEIAQKVRKTKQPITLGPTKAQNRKVVHRVIAQYKVLTSRTIKNGPSRDQIVIRYKNKPQNSK